jgi:hypothetical protein
MGGGRGELRVEQRRISEKATIGGGFESEKQLKRHDIIRRLTAICAMLERWAEIKKPVNPIRIQAYRTAIYGYSVAVSALKDEELELRVLALEEKLKNGVLIPIEAEKKP